MTRYYAGTLSGEQLVVLASDYDALAEQLDNPPLVAENNALNARIAQLIADRESSAIASATLRDESIAKNERIAQLEAALRDISECTVKTDCGIDPMRAAGLRQAFEITSEIAAAALAPKEPSC